MNLCCSVGLAFKISKVHLQCWRFYSRSWMHFCTCLQFCPWLYFSIWVPSFSSIPVIIPLTRSSSARRHLPIFLPVAELRSLHAHAFAQNTFLCCSADDCRLNQVVCVRVYELMASLGTNIDTVTNCVLVEGDVASIQYIRHFRFAPLYFWADYN